MRPTVLDTETSINNHEYWQHSRNPANDVYSIIYGDHPDRVSVLHKENGFHRTLPAGLLDEIDVLVGQNLSFDLGYIWKDEQWQKYLSVESNTIWDVAEAHYILSGQRHKYPSLAEMQEVYLGQKIKQDRISKLFKKGIGADKILSRRNDCRRIFALYEKYCRDDGVTTLRIFAAQYRQAKKQGSLKLIQSRMKGLLAIIMMQNTGIHIDVVKCEKQLRDFRLKSLHYLNKAVEMTKEYWDERLGTFNINSPKQKSAMLFGGDFQIPKRVEDGMYKNGNQKYKTIQETIHINGFALPTNLTQESKKDGCYVTDAATINKIYKESDNEEAKEYCRLQKLAMRYSKMVSTYLEPFLNYSIDGVLYPNFNTTETETSRLSSSKPNMQNVPASGELLPAIQGQLVAPEGWVAVDIDYCLAPETKVLTEDFIWKEINDIVVGDKLVGFEEFPKNKGELRYLEQSIVTHKKILKKDCLKIVTEENEIICSKDHMFLVQNSQSELVWTKAEDLDPRYHTFTRVSEVWDTPNNQETGWMGGFLDGEGFITSKNCFGVGQNDDGHNKLCFDEAVRLLDKYMINCYSKIDGRRRCKQIRPWGLRTSWQAVGIFQPHRLKAKLQEIYSQTTIRGKRNRKVKILKLVDVGVREVIAIQTTTKTFLAEGFMSHNCQLEPFITFTITGDKALAHDLTTGVCLHCRAVSWIPRLSEGKTYEEIYQLAKVEQQPDWVFKRKKAKAINFKRAYGGGAKSLAEAEDLDIEDIKAVFESQDAAYPQVKEFNERLYEGLTHSQQLSRYSDFSKHGRIGRRFEHGIELLPIFDGKSQKQYISGEYRHYGSYTSIFGHKFTFEEIGHIDKWGRVRRRYSTTETRNYQVQGSAGDVVQLASAECMYFVLKHLDKVRMVRTIHDAISFYVKKGEESLIIPELCNIMRGVKHLVKKYLDVEIPHNYEVEAKIGDDFGTMQTYSLAETPRDA